MVSTQLKLEFYEEDKDFNSRLSKVETARLVSRYEKEESPLESLGRYLSGQNERLFSPALWRLYRCLMGVCPYMRELL